MIKAKALTKLFFTALLLILPLSVNGAGDQFDFWERTEIHLAANGDATTTYDDINMISAANKHVLSNILDTEQVYAGFYTASVVLSFKMELEFTARSQSGSVNVAILQVSEGLDAIIHVYPAIRISESAQKFSTDISAAPEEGVAFRLLFLVQEPDKAQDIDLGLSEGAMSLVKPAAQAEASDDEAQNNALAIALAVMGGLVLIAVAALPVRNYYASRASKSG